MPTADEIRRRAVAAALTAESCLSEPASTNAARAWAAVAHALIAAADIQAGIEERETPPMIGPPPGYSLR